MPEYNTSKKRSMSEEELRAEYRREGGAKKKKKWKNPVAAHKEKKIIHEARTAPPPVSPARMAVNKEAETRRINEQRRRKEEQRRSAKRKKARKRKSMTLYYIMFGVLITAVLSILSVTVLFNISSVTVEGESVYSDEEIIEAGEIRTGENLVRFNSSAAEQKILEKLVYIDKVTVSRGFPDKLIVKVTAAEPALCIKSGKKYYVSSANGKLLEISGSPVSALVADGIMLKDDLKPGDTIQGLEDEDALKLEVLRTLSEEMKGLGLNASAEINMTDRMDISIIYDGRIRMELGSDAQLHRKLYAASVLLDEYISPDDRMTILLTNPERVVTRPIYGDVTEEVTTTPEQTTLPEETSDAEETTAPEAGE